MNNLSPEQAKVLFEAGGFVLLTNLPEGSEFGIDGTYHVIRRFSGIKFLPPGLHLITWTPPPSIPSKTSEAGPSTIPIRSGIFRYFNPKERYVLEYDRKIEDVPRNSQSSFQPKVVISDDHLRSLDKELAPYPFDGLENWKSLTGFITPEVLKEVMGEEGRVDGMTQVEGEEEEDSKGIQQFQREAGEWVLRFPKFNIKRSWRDGAFGEEVTRYSKDKSWLLANVVQEQFAGDPLRLLAYLQLSFILLLHLSSYSALGVYKRFLNLLSQSSSILSPHNSLLPKTSHQSMRKLYSNLIPILTAQLSALPKTAFESELPEIDIFYLEQINGLRAGFGGVTEQKEAMISSWRRLRLLVKERYGWDVDDLLEANTSVEDDAEEEEGEYAPVIVET